MLYYCFLHRDKNSILKNIYFDALLELFPVIQPHFGTNYKGRKLTVAGVNFYSKSTGCKFRLVSSNRSLCESRAIIVYLEINLESKLIFQEDEITHTCRQLPPKGSNDLEQEKNEEYSLCVF